MRKKLLGGADGQALPERIYEAMFVTAEVICFQKFIIISGISIGP